jgi:hypothetical protein
MPEVLEIRAFERFVSLRRQNIRELAATKCSANLRNAFGDLFRADFVHGQSIGQMMFQRRAPRCAGVEKEADIVSVAGFHGGADQESFGFLQEQMIA